MSDLIPLAALNELRFKTRIDKQREFLNQIDAAIAQGKGE